MAIFAFSMPNETMSEIALISWGFDSGEHTKHMYDQQVSCGWRSDEVGGRPGDWKEGEYSKLDYVEEIRIGWVVLQLHELKGTTGMKIPPF